MRKLNYDNLPHLVSCTIRIIQLKLFSLLGNIAAAWWGVKIGVGSVFNGCPKFKRHPDSQIIIGSNCAFNSSPTSNLIGVNRPCIISTLQKGAIVKIGNGCGFSGTVIGSAKKIVIGKNVRCGANTLITDTDWHTDDSRAGSDAPVIIGDNVWLGLNVTVLKGVTIGENTFIAIGSVVTRSIPPNVVAGGIPAKILKTIKPLLPEKERV